MLFIFLLLSVKSLQADKLLYLIVIVNFNYECLQVDGAKLVSVNSREEHAFIVRWLSDNAKQGYISVYCSMIDTVVTVVFSVKLYSEFSLQRYHIMKIVYVD